jgi:DNA primase
VTDDAVAEIKARLDILEVVGGYVTLHRSGGQHTGLCPLHPEKSPSFVVSQPKQVWHCHGCHEGGDIFTFIQKIERVDFARALEILAERAGVELERAKSPAGGGAARRRRILELNDRAARFYEHVLWNLPAGEPGRHLLAERGVDPALARLYRVGFAPAGGQEERDLTRYLVRRDAQPAEIAAAGLTARGRDLFRHRLVFPISDERGQVLAFGGRALGEVRPKYLNTPETGVYHKSSALFGLEQARDALRAKREVVVVEGYFDVLAAHAAGVLHTVASSGTALAREQARLLARQADSAILCFDGDEAGRMAASRAVDVCAAEGLPTRIAVMPEGVKDPDEMVRQDPAAFAALIAGAAPEWQVLVDWAIGDAGSRVEERRSAAERVVAVLVRIPTAATRDLYVQEASRRLGLSAASLAADVARALSRPARGAVRVTAPPIAESPPDASQAGEAAEGLEDDDPGHPLLPWEEYLGTYVLHRPALARLLVGTMGFAVDELASPQVRRLVAIAVGVPDGVGFPVHALGPADRRLAAGLLVRDVPELAADAEPGAVEQAIADCVERVRFTNRQQRAQREIDGLLGASIGSGAGADDGVAARLREVIAERRKPQERP